MDWNNKDVVLEAVKIHPKSLEYASEDLKADKEVVMIALRQNVWAW